MKWRLIIDHRGGPAINMAVDEAISLSTKKDNAPPTLRIYFWSRPAVTIGYFQKIREEVDLRYCLERGIDVVRRLTGGRAIVHDLEELTYSFSAPFEDPFKNRNLHDTYLAISEAFVTGFRDLAIDVEMCSARSTSSRPGRSPVCFQSLGLAEASVNGRKVIGSAQKRWTKGFLQQGSIPLDLNFDLLYRALSFPSDALRKRAREAANKKMAGLRSFAPELSMEELTDAIRRGFERRFNVILETEKISSEEQNTVSELLERRYGNESWNNKR